MQATVSVEMLYNRTRGQTVPFLKIIRVRGIINQMKHTGVSDYFTETIKS